MSLTGSMMNRIVRCPGSFKLCNDFPNEIDRDNSFADEGTTAHWIANDCLINNRQVDSWLGKRPVNNEIVDDEMVDNIENYLFYLELLSPQGGNSEVRLKIDGFSGTPDYFVYDSYTKKLTIVDLKYGFKLVDVFQNWQLISYAYLWWINNSEVSISAEFHIYQPRGYHPDGVSRVQRVDNLELMAYFSKLSDTFKIIHRLNAPTKAGIHCLYCSAMLNCTTNMEVCENIYRVSVSPCGVELSNSSIGNQLEIFEHTLEIIKQRVSVLKTVGQERVKRGGIIPQYGMMNTKGKRSWNIDNRKAKAIGIPFKKPELVSPRQAELAGVPKSLVDLNSVKKSGFKFVKVNTLDEANKVLGPSPQGGIWKN